MCEDLLIMDRVDESELEKILDDMEKFNLKYCKFTAPVKGMPIGNSGLLTKVKMTTPYSRNLAIGIYRTDYLAEIIGDGTRSPWEIESEWLKETHSAPKDVYFNDIVIVNKDILYATNAVLKGRWYSSTIQKLKK